MSIRTTRNVFCDIADEQPCDGWLDTDPDLSAAQMRAIGFYRGWKRVSRDGRLIDICPRHARAATR